VLYNFEFDIEYDIELSITIQCINVNLNEIILYVVMLQTVRFSNQTKHKIVLFEYRTKEKKFVSNLSSGTQFVILNQKKQKFKH